MIRWSIALRIRRSSDFGEPFDVLRAVCGSAELTVEAPVEPLSRAVNGHRSTGVV